MISVDRMSDLLTDPFQRGTARLALTLSPGNTAASARVEPYDFAEHLARFEAEPDPRYVVTALEDVTTATTLTFDYDVPAADGSPITGTADCPIPAGTLAGMSVLVPLGRDQGPAVRLRGLITTTPSPDRGLAAHQLWEVTALLGNLGKLLWIVGWERDALRGQLAQVRRQDRLDRAVGQTLDLVGFDLGVPRFPPLPYAFEDDTVALYHLDEPSGATQARDAQVLYTGVGHPSSTLTATPGAVGRFGSGYAFRDAAAQILVDNHVDFATGPGDDLTVECFVQPDPGAWSGPVVSKHDPAGAGKAGWSLAIGEFGRGLPRNVRATVTDGTRTVIVHADTTLDAGRFHHLALVVDRAPAQVRLYVDGVVRAAAEITQLGALTNAEPLRIGRAAPTAADAFTGVIDEVRLSRAARTGFHAVLGESDEGYRRRLRIFQRWTLPTLDVLQEALNDVVSDVAGEAEPFVIDEQDATLVSAVRGLTVYPAALLTGESIDADGNRRTPESSVPGPSSYDVMPPRPTRPRASSISPMWRRPCW